jgi:hypothetical protein
MCRLINKLKHLEKQSYDPVVLRGNNTGTDRSPEHEGEPPSLCPAVVKLGT